MEYRELLDKLAEKLGGDQELAPDDTGAVLLDIDGMVVTLMGVDEAGVLAITAPIAEPPPQDRLELLYRAALVANHNFAGTAGATLSINPETKRLSLCRVMPLVTLDGDQIVAELEKFVNTLETWRDLVENFRGAEIGGADTPDERPLEMPEFGGSGFMQV